MSRENIKKEHQREIGAKVVKENRHMSADAEIKGDRQSTRIKRPNVLYKEFVKKK